MRASWRWRSRPGNRESRPTIGECAPSFGSDGSFLLGLLLRFALATPEVSPDLRVALAVGFYGGYTTFSTFSVETITMVEVGAWERALLYVGLSVAASLIGAFAGVVLAHELLVLRHPA